jgi:hypothetical protein
MATCNDCGSRSEFSLCLLISTKGQRPRRQKCSRALVLCAACMRGLEGRLDTAGLPDIGKRLSDAHTAIALPTAEPHARQQEKA